MNNPYRVLYILIYLFLVSLYFFFNDISFSHQSKQVQHLYQSLLYVQGNHIGFYKFLLNENDILIWDFPLYSLLVYILSKLNTITDINSNLIFSSKILSLFFFYFGLLYFIKFLKIEYKKEINYFVLVFTILINPFTLFWSTSVNSETLLFFLLCCSMYNYKKNTINPNFYNSFLLLIFSSLAMLIKIHLSFAFLLAMWINYLNIKKIKYEIIRITILLISLTVSVLWYLNIDWPFEWSDKVINENVIIIYLTQMIQYMSPFYLIEILTKKIFFEMLGIIFVPFFILGIISYKKKIRLTLLIILLSIIFTNYFLFYHSYYWLSLFPFYALINYMGFIYLKKKIKYLRDFLLLNLSLIVFFIYYLIPPLFYDKFDYNYDLEKISELKPLFALFDQNINVENIEAANIIHQNFNEKEPLIIFSNFTQHLTLPFFTNKQVKIIRCKKLKADYEFYNQLYGNYIVDKSSCKFNSNKKKPLLNNNKYSIY